MLHNNCRTCTFWRTTKEEGKRPKVLWGECLLAQTMLNGFHSTGILYTMETFYCKEFKRDVTLMVLKEPEANEACDGEQKVRTKTFETPVRVN